MVKVDHPKTSSLVRRGDVVSPPSAGSLIDLLLCCSFLLQRITSQTCDRLRPFSSAAYVWPPPPLQCRFSFYTQLYTPGAVLQTSVTFQMSVCEELMEKYIYLFCSWIFNVIITFSFLPGAWMKFPSLIASISIGQLNSNWLRTCCFWLRQNCLRKTRISDKH